MLRSLVGSEMFIRERFITAGFDKYLRKKQKGIYSPNGWAYQQPGEIKPPIEGMGAESA